MAKNRTFNLSASMGETLRPTIISLVESFNQVLAKVSAWVKENPELTGQMLRVVAGVAALAAGFGAVTLAMASFLGPFAMVRYGLTLFGLQGASLAGSLLNLGRNALPLVLRGVLLIGRALMLNPIGLAVTAIAGAAYLIYKNWAPIKAFFLGLWEEVKAGFNGGFAGIGKLIMDFSPLGLFSRAFAAVMSYFGVELPGKFSAFGGMLPGRPGERYPRQAGGREEGHQRGRRQHRRLVQAEAGDPLAVPRLRRTRRVHHGRPRAGPRGRPEGPLSAVLDLAKQLAAAGAADDRRQRFSPGPGLPPTAGPPQEHPRGL